MKTCHRCDRFILERARVCPFCQAPHVETRCRVLASIGLTLGVALAGCGDSKSTSTMDTMSAETTEAMTETTQTSGMSGESSLTTQDYGGSYYTVSGDYTTTTTLGTTVGTSDTATTESATDGDTDTDTDSDTETDTDSDSDSDASSSGTTG